jgi:hypothetical protein
MRRNLFVAVSSEGYPPSLNAFDNIRVLGSERAKDSTTTSLPGPGREGGREGGR